MRRQRGPGKISKTIFPVFFRVLSKLVPGFCVQHDRSIHTLTACPVIPCKDPFAVLQRTCCGTWTLGFGKANRKKDVGSPAVLTKASRAVSWGEMAAFSLRSIRGTSQAVRGDLPGIRREGLGPLSDSLVLQVSAIKYLRVGCFVPAGTVRPPIDRRAVAGFRLGESHVHACNGTGSWKPQIDCVGCWGR
jgi:hypothetical protein